ncbi:MAG: hypothetical protein KF763_12000 [Cyclobacteriaceae bacterium]|nr:hypothetical protein [Cyclobacteriaceae bacterium]
MDAKITLRFDATVIERAKRFADKQNISLSRLTELLYDKITHQSYASLEDIAVADWVIQVAEGKAEYRTKKRSRKSLRNEFLKSQK